ncbi:MAG: hypothetical protein LBL94_07690 [Prevotellaceae bacterium]|nr:hypothetical protein [Prevotellaceae bacterium]
MKKIFYIALFGLFGLNVSAQISPDFGGLGLQLSSNQQLIEDAVKDGIFILKQSYQIKDVATTPPTYYRWGDNPHMGTVYTVGIKAADGFYTCSKALSPWNYDKRYEQYRKVATYLPVISETSYRPLDSAKYAAMTFSADSSIFAVDSSIIHLKTGLFERKGFREDYSPGAKAGWLVWIASDKNIAEADAVHISLTIYKTELRYEAGKNRYEVKKPAVAGKVIIGGLYLVPEVTGIGEIVFKLAGFAHKLAGRWNVVVPAASQAAARQVGLTPIKTKDN